MEKKVLVVCIIAAAVGLLSAVLGFAAEATKVKLSQITVDSTTDECLYPGTPAFGLGLASAATFLMALLIINIASGCFCCAKRHIGQPNRRCQCNVALVCFIFSWITFVPAFLQLISSSILNSQHLMDSTYAGNCYVVKSGVFAGSSCLSLISVTLGLIYYISFNSGKSSTDTTTTTSAQNNGIAMGYPQVPPTTQQPAFVHEDTYMRRQFT